MPAILAPAAPPSRSSIRRVARAVAAALAAALLAATSAPAQVVALGVRPRPASPSPWPHLRRSTFSAHDAAPAEVAAIESPLARATADPEVVVTSLAVRVKTSSLPLSGTDHDVYFDIGPFAWKISDGGGFPRGSERTVPLSLDALGFKRLRVKDIAMLRLEKKGLFGFTDAPDFILDGAVTPIPTSVADLVADLRHQAAVARYAAQQAQTVVDAQRQVVAQADAALTSLLGSIKDLTDAEKRAIDRLSQVRMDIANIDLRLANEVKQFIERNVCQARPAVVAVVGFLVGHPEIALVCWTLRELNDEWLRLTEAVAGLRGAQSEAEAEIAKFVAERKPLLDQVANAKDVLGLADAALRTQLQLLQTAVAASRAADAALAEAEELAQQMPSLPVNASLLPGQWHVTSVTLVVNGADYLTLPVDAVLRRGHSEWRAYVRPMSPEEQFVSTLRAFAPRYGSDFDEVVAAATTVAKAAGVSGWKRGPVELAFVEGILARCPSAGADGFVSLDLLVERVVANHGSLKNPALANAPRVELASAHVVGTTDLFAVSPSVVEDGWWVEPTNVPHARWLRVEYRHRDPDNPATDDTRFQDWLPGMRVRVAGAVAFDTDGPWHTEVHPLGADNIEAEPFATALVKPCQFKPGVGGVPALLGPKTFTALKEAKIAKWISHPLLPGPKLVPGLPKFAPKLKPKLGPTPKLGPKPVPGFKPKAPIGSGAGPQPAPLPKPTLTPVPKTLPKPSLKGSPGVVPKPHD